ncbi:erythromycin esterase family protein [Haloimpatiens lingqiaonensis]|uniref:erythromycin esterase family protein n=1 Tax=Haloimpatiens lingqiaonensis TaxID=1380675 RepID=UPI0010FCF652|nr:erythromycin esterase family protein [Haloimpatiens lingqiaonensis]
MSRKIVSLLIIIILSLNLIGCTKNTTSEKAYKKYLSKNATSLDLKDNDDFSSFTLLDKDTKNDEIFLVGESHNIKTNYDIKWKLLKYFKDKTDFKYLLLEDTYVNSLYLNRYLQTGDESYLKKVYMPNKEDYEFWYKLYKYNSQLEKNDKIIAVGIDITSPSTSNDYLISVLESKKLSEPLNKHLDLLKSIKEQLNAFNDNNSSNEEFININKLKYIKEKINITTTEIYKNEQSYKNILGKDSFNFFMALNALRQGFDIFDTTKKYKNLMDMQTEAHRLRRDSAMYENFKNVYNHLPEGKWFGDFGLHHVFQHPIVVNDPNDTLGDLNTKWFSSYINSGDLRIKNKVLSISLLYDDCISAYSGIISSYKKGQPIDQHLKSNCTLVKLNGKKSPYAENLQWNFVDTAIGRPKSGVTTDYFQYVIVVKNGQASTPVDN